MLEESTGVPGADHRQRQTDRLDQGFFRPGLSFTHEPLDLREGLLNRVEIRRVGWQVDELATSLLDQLSYPLSLVGAQVVHHNHLTLTQCGSQDLLHISFEYHRSGRAFHEIGRASCRERV